MYLSSGFDFLEFQLPQSQGQLDAVLHRELDKSALETSQGRSQEMSQNPAWDFGHRGAFENLRCATPHRFNRSMSTPSPRLRP